MPAQLLPRRAGAALAAALLALSLLVAAAPAAGGAAREDRLMVDVLVTLHDGLSASRGLAERVAGFEAEVRHVYSHALQGFSARLPAAAARALARRPEVDLVESDGPVSIAAQQVPTGVRRVFAAPDHQAIPIDGYDDFRVDADVAVLDTGVDHTHPDLVVVNRVECLDSTCAPGGDDVEGHGTHVAGVAAALDNEFGVVGVAPGARIWSVKVLDNDGHGRLSDIVRGIDYVTANSAHIDVANLSFTSTSSSLALDTAIATAVDAGVVVVAAAGNDSRNAVDISPAKHPDVITVSALADYDGRPGGLHTGPRCANVGRDDTLATFSNFGAVIDIVAPGACILSTRPGGDLEPRNGTSMATPYVAGAAAILASAAPPADRVDVEALRALLVSAGNYKWSDTSGDGHHEPLLDLSDSVLFAPETVPTTSLTVTAPAPGDLLAGRVQIETTSSGDLADVSQVEFLVDGTAVGVDATAPYSLSWASTTVSDGARELRAVVHNDGQRLSTAPTWFVVDNTSPTATITTPTQGASVRGSVTVRISATDPGSGLARLRLLAAGRTLLTSPTSPAESVWDTTGVPDGIHRIVLEATDLAGNSTERSLSVQVDNSVPNVAITAPAVDEVVSGAMVVAASAHDASEVTELRFKANGRSLGMTRGGSGEVTWDTTTVSDGTVTISVTALDAAGNVGESTRRVTVRNSAAAEPHDTHPAILTAERLSGPDRFATAARVSSATFPEGASRVFVATGLEFPDALAAGSVAAAGDVPLLLTAQATLPAATDQELARLRPREIVLVGGTKAVSAEVAASLSRHAPVRRVHGRDRFETAALLATEAHAAPVPVAFVASGLRFPDALAGGPTAALLGGPLLLVTDEGVPAATAEALRSLQPARIVVLGGRGVIGDEVLTALRQLTPGTVDRLAGTDRFATAVAVSRASYPQSSDTAFIATGITYADALAGAPAAARARGPILLVARDTLPEAVAIELRRLAPSRLVFLGGASAVSDEVLRAAVAAASP